MKIENNPFLTNDWMPRYDEMTPQLADDALSAAIGKANDAIDEFEKNIEPSWNGLFVELHKITFQPFSVWGVVSHLLSVVNSDEWRKLEEKFQPKIIEFAQRVSQSKAVYNAMKKMAGETKENLSAWQCRILEANLRDAQLAGVALDDEKREIFNKIQLEIAKTSTLFNNNVLDTVKAFELILTQPCEVEGLKPDYLAQCAAKANGSPEKGPWKITLDYASYVPFMQYATHRPSREKVYRAFSTRAATAPHDNTQLIETLIELHTKTAKLLGFDDYASLSLSRKMAPNISAIETLLGSLIEPCKAPAKKELDNLAEFAHSCGFEGKIEPWDKSFWCERQKEALYNYDEEELRKYFPLEFVMSGLFKLLEKLFNVKFEQQNGEIHAWHEDVRFYNVKDSDGNKIAGLYFDPYCRPGTKNGGAWMNTVHSRDNELTGSLILPVALIACNQTKPIAGNVATMLFSEVVTLFHEMGHALQHILTKIDSSYASGINNVEWDAVEIASQFLENFCYDPAVIKSISKHVDTKEELPDEMIARITAAKNYFAANAMLRQIYFAKTDLTIYAADYKTKFSSANDAKEKIAKEVLPDPPPATDRFLNAFTHIFCGGYCAGYYSYKWSETLSADVFMAFQDVGLNNDAEIIRLGKLYRDTFLALGGSVHPAEVFKAFRGREPDTKAILKLADLI